MDICKVCGSWRNEIHHKCLPLWLCWIEDDGESIEDAYKIYSVDVEDAAAEFAEIHDSNTAGECWNSNGFNIVVTVSGEDGERFCVEVDGEATTTYTARKPYPSPNQQA